MRIRFEVLSIRRTIRWRYAANLIAVSIDESMIVAHQLGQTFNVVRVDAIDDGEKGSFVAHVRPISSADYADFADSARPSQSQLIICVICEICEEHSRSS